MSVVEYTSIILELTEDIAGGKRIGAIFLDADRYTYVLRLTTEKEGFAEGGSFIFQRVGIRPALNFGSVLVKGLIFNKTLWTNNTPIPPAMPWFRPGDKI